MADEAVPSAEAAPEAPPPPAVDEEKERLKAELAATKAADAQKTQALSEVAGMVQSGKLKLADQNPPPAVEEDDTALIDRKELKRREQVFREQVAGAIIQQTTVNARLARSNTINYLRPTLKNFDKHEAEVTAILDKIPDPVQAANPETIVQAYNVIAAKYLKDDENDIRADERARFRQELAEQGIDVGDEPASPAGRIPGAMPSPSRTGVAPVGDAMNRSAISRRDTSVKPLTRDEKIAANLFKLTPDEFRKYGDRTWSPDLLGSKGREKF